MSMTKKDFEAIAEAIKRQAEAQCEEDGQNEFQRAVLHDLAYDLCDHFKTSNPNFQRDRFMTACGF